MAAVLSHLIAKMYVPLMRMYTVVLDARVSYGGSAGPTHLRERSRHTAAYAAPWCPIRKQSRTAKMVAAAPSSAAAAAAAATTTPAASAHVTRTLSAAPHTSLRPAQRCAQCSETHERERAISTIGDVLLQEASLTYSAHLVIPALCRAPLLARPQLQSYTRGSYQPGSRSAIKSFSRAREDRGVGTSPTGCSGNREYDAGLCYDKCDAGYYGVGAVCWRSCPPKSTDCGSYCVPQGTSCAAFVGGMYQSCIDR